MLKRIFDLLLSVIVLFITLPIFLLLALLVRIIMGGPVFFTQVRAGKDGKPFKMYKFRSMTNEKDNEGNLLSDKLRLTKFGEFLRSSSLDELPELLNVINGEMSLVGPRPLFMRYLEYYTEEEQKRHTVRPGITGYAQVNGRNNLDWDKRLALDVYYVKNQSLWLDIKILIKTVNNVLQRKDIQLVPGLSKKPLDIERKL